MTLSSAGHEGLLQQGGVQWMTAGRGVIHSELPEQEAGRMEGFQLWLYRGELQIGGKQVPQQRMAILKNSAGSDGVVLHAAAPARALLIAGRPLREPIAQYGPFVMNTQAEIFQAINDFREGRLGIAE